MVKQFQKLVAVIALMAILGFSYSQVTFQAKDITLKINPQIAFGLEGLVPQTSFFRDAIQQHLNLVGSTQESDIKSNDASAQTLRNQVLDHFTSVCTDFVDSISTKFRSSVIGSKFRSQGCQTLFQKVNEGIEDRNNYIRLTSAVLGTLDQLEFSEIQDSNHVDQWAKDKNQYVMGEVGKHVVPCQFSLESEGCLHQRGILTRAYQKFKPTVKNVESQAKSEESSLSRQFNIDLNSINSLNLRNLHGRNDQTKDICWNSYWQDQVKQQGQNKVDEITRMSILNNRSAIEFIRNRDIDRRARAVMNIHSPANYYRLRQFKIDTEKTVLQELVSGDYESIYEYIIAVNRLTDAETTILTKITGMPCSLLQRQTVLHLNRDQTVEFKKKFIQKQTLNKKIQEIKQNEIMKAALQKQIQVRLAQMKKEGFKDKKKSYKLMNLITKNAQFVQNTRMKLPNLDTAVALKKCQQAHPKQHCVSIEQLGVPLENNLRGVAVQCPQNTHAVWTFSSYKCYPNVPNSKHQYITSQISVTSLRIKENYYFVPLVAKIMHSLYTLLGSQFQGQIFQKLFSFSENSSEHHKLYQYLYETAKIYRYRDPRFLSLQEMDGNNSKMVGYYEYVQKEFLDELRPYQVNFNFRTFYTKVFLEGHEQAWSNSYEIPFKQLNGSSPFVLEKDQLVLKNKNEVDLYWHSPFTWRPEASP